MSGVRLPMIGAPLEPWRSRAVREVVEGVDETAFGITLAWSNLFQPLWHTSVRFSFCFVVGLIQDN